MTRDRYQVTSEETGGDNPLMKKVDMALQRLSKGKQTQWEGKYSIPVFICHKMDQ